MTDKAAKTSQNGDEFKFRMDAQAFTFATEGEGEARKRFFRGVAYSGAVIPNHWYWDNVVFDLATMSVPAKMPALVDHDRSARAGFCTSHNIDSAGLTVHGTLLSNAAGKTVASDSDEGFPWQMSVHIEPGSVDQVKAGTQVSVNGMTLDGPVTVFRNSRLNEVSFTATGWDANTSASAMSRGNQTPPQGTPTMTDLEKAQAQIAEQAKALEAATAAANKATADLAAFSKGARDREVTQLFSDLGREYKADGADVLAFAAMPQEAFDVAAKMLREGKAPAAPGVNANATLFSHQAAAGNAPSAAPAEDALLADAKRRATEFSKRAA